MAALLLDLGPGDEVIMPSFTFVATATAVVLRGAVPVFVDIREDTLNIDESLIEAAITSRTKAIVVVHYAGVGCEMDALSDIAARHSLVLIEDAAQGILAKYRGRPLGGIGSIGAMSFHETKNVHCGEGGALLLNDDDCRVRAEILQEKGTNRSQFFRGEVDKYTWVDVGSSYLVSDVTAAFLAAQLERASEIINDRLQVWDTFHAEFADLEATERLRRPVVPEHCEHNGHIYYLLLPDLEQRTSFIQTLADRGIHAVFHYVPLHSSPAGRRYGRVAGAMPVTLATSDRLVRLPLWWDMPDGDVAQIIDAVEAAVASPV
jgi:dTDP-4-amino-4,6-dideoxygalactose transaminase